MALQLDPYGIATKPRSVSRLVPTARQWQLYSPQGRVLWDVNLMSTGRLHFAHGTSFVLYYCVTL